MSVSINEIQELQAQQELINQIFQYLFKADEQFFTLCAQLPEINQLEIFIQAMSIYTTVKKGINTNFVFAILRNILKLDHEKLIIEPYYSQYITSLIQSLGIILNNNYYSDLKIYPDLKIYSQDIDFLLAFLAKSNIDSQTIKNVVKSLGLFVRQYSHFSGKISAAILNKLLKRLGEVEINDSDDIIQVIRGLGKLAKNDFLEGTLEGHSLEALISKLNTLKIRPQDIGQLLSGIGFLVANRYSLGEIGTNLILPLLKILIDEPNLSCIDDSLYALGVIAQSNELNGNFPRQLIDKLIKKLSHKFEPSRTAIGCAYLGVTVPRFVQKQLLVKKPEPDFNQFELRDELLKELSHEIINIEIEKLVGEAWFVDLHFETKNKRKFIIELDGNKHYNSKGELSAKDRLRDNYLKKKDPQLSILRYRVSGPIKDLVAKIIKEVKENLGLYSEVNLQNNQDGVSMQNNNQTPIITNEINVSGNASNSIESSSIPPVIFNINYITNINNPIINYIGYNAPSLVTNGPVFHGVPNYINNEPSLVSNTPTFYDGADMSYQPPIYTNDATSVFNPTPHIYSPSNPVNETYITNINNPTVNYLSNTNNHFLSPMFYSQQLQQNNSVPVPNNNTTKPQVSVSSAHAGFFANNSSSNQARPLNANAPEWSFF